MSDDTTDLGIEFCPGCNPQDPFEHREDGKVWVIRWHDRCLSLRGSADDLIPSTEYLSGNAESAGATNRLIQGLIR